MPHPCCSPQTNIEKKQHIENRNQYARYFPDTYISKSEIQKCFKEDANITLLPHCPPAV